MQAVFTGTNRLLNMTMEGIENSTSRSMRLYARNHCSHNSAAIATILEITLIHVQFKKCGKGSNREASQQLKFFGRTKFHPEVNFTLICNNIELLFYYTNIQDEILKKIITRFYKKQCIIIFFPK